jgi:DNA-binding transcriptional regulator YhcF (GntR family)
MKKHPARDKAEKLIKRLLFAGDIDTLPSVRELSRQSGASPATVWKVISHLLKEPTCNPLGHEVRIVKKGC